ncbi:MAG: hypothetical protein V3T17_02790 [Pseudomonadales bacterium]
MTKAADNSESKLYDPAQLLGFDMYKSVDLKTGQPSPVPDHYISLLHYAESEKYRCVDERYRQYILSLVDSNEIILECSGISNPSARSDWLNIRTPVLTAGLWSQIQQNRHELSYFASTPNIDTTIPAISSPITTVLSWYSAIAGINRVCVMGPANFKGPLYNNDKVSKGLQDASPHEVILFMNANFSSLINNICLNYFFSIAWSRLRPKDTIKDQILRVVQYCTSGIIFLYEEEAHMQYFGSIMANAKKEVKYIRISP